MRITETFTLAPVRPISEETKAAILGESRAVSLPRLVLRPKIEAIHATITRNNVEYFAEALKGSKSAMSGVYSMTFPYEKPILKNHDSWTEPLGRIKEAAFVTNGRTGKACIVIQPEITEYDAIMKFLDGRYKTVSIGANVENVYCSICGRNLMKDGWCEHNRGMRYDTKGNPTDSKKGILCTWQVKGEKDLFFEEVSTVNSPGDVDAQVLDPGEVMEVSESYDEHQMEAFVVVGDKAYDLSKKEGEPGFCFEALQLTEAAGMLINESAPEEDTEANKGDDLSDSMKTDTWERTNLAHRLLHMWWKDPEKSTWPKEMVKRWHTKVVSTIVNKYENNHNLSDGLDETLPASLKKKSNGGSKKEK